MNVIIFSPHPDDELIGCGGTLIRHIKNYDNVTVVYITSGENGNPNYSPDELLKIREKEAKKGLDIIGIKDALFLRQRDKEFKNSRHLCNNIGKILIDLSPHLIYLPHKNESHPDHKKTYQIVKKTICSLAPKNSRMRLMTYEVWSPLNEFDVINDVTNQMDQKIRALREHKSQLERLRYDEAVKSLNRYRGILSGEGVFCEVFKTIR